MRSLVDLVVRNRKRSAIIAAALIASVGAGVAASDKDKRAEWRHYLGAQDSASYSTLNQINRVNVSRLQVAWQFDPMDMPAGSAGRCGIRTGWRVRRRRRAEPRDRCGSDRSGRRD